MKKIFSLLVLSFLTLIPHLTSAYAEKRVALVIGNAAYEHVSKLTNPVNDANLMTATLKQLNFEVISQINLSQKGMKRAVSRFANKLRSYGPDTIGLVFYAGHGVQVSGLNYLVPVDAAITSESDVAIESVAANDLLYAMNQAGNRINIIIFDACRDNPYRTLFRSGNGGLAQMNAPQGSLISFATSPGSVAADGLEQNSPFTKSLAKHLKTPGITIERVLKRVGRDVVRSTRRKQRPWWNRDIYEDLYLAGVPKKQPTKLAAIPNPKPTNKAISKTNKTAPVRPAIVKPDNQFTHGYKFDDCNGAGWCPKMIVVRGSNFTILTPDHLEKNVKVKSFAVGRFEITFGEWDTCAKDGGCGRYHPNDKGWGRGKHPVINVSWHDAKNYIKWLNKKTGKRYRLLTDAEWQYVASANKTSPYWWGPWISSTLANYKSSYVNNLTVAEVFRKKTLPTNTFNPNPFGLYNVHGNVWEWVEDRYIKSRASMTNQDLDQWGDRFNAQYGKYEGKKHIIRGGSWRSEAESLHVTHRNSSAPTGRFDDVGFRIARDL